MFDSRFMPCRECGESVDSSQAGEHRCDSARRADYQMSVLREEIAGFEPRLRDYLDSAAGRFETWLAAQRVRGRR